MGVPKWMREDLDRFDWEELKDAWQTILRVDRGAAIHKQAERRVEMLDTLIEEDLEGDA